MLIFVTNYILTVISYTEENYLKAIFKIAERETKAVSTNAIAAELGTTAASVTDMLKRLAEKNFIYYEKYKGVTLSPSGEKEAKLLIRKHRLWETFLVEKLNFGWDEVHDIAEELEHIPSALLIERLEKFLGNPKFDPHGDPIPDANGVFARRNQILLSTLQAQETAVVVGVQEHSPLFLQYLQRLGLTLGVSVTIIEKLPYDESLQIRLDHQSEFWITQKVAQNIFIVKE